MVRREVFERGDIVRVSLNPTMGHEQQGERPALVLSRSEVNSLGVVLVAPITQGGDYSRFAGFATSLTGSGTETQGVALVSMVRMMDLDARHAVKIERAPTSVVDDALARLRTITD